jgi:hypothetical protein
VRSTLKGIVVAGSASLVLAAPAAAKTYEVTKRGDPAPNGCKRKSCSLREAVIAANNHGGPDRVVLPEKKAYNLSIENSIPPGEDEAAEGDLDIIDALAIVHPGKGRAKIDAHGIDRVLHLLDSGDATLKRIVVRGGLVDATSSSGGGGGINSEGPDLALRRTNVVRNEIHSGFGGGIDLEDNSAADLTLTRSSISANASDGDSGGIDASDDGALVLNRSKIVSNRSGADGGGILDFFGGGSRINKSTIANNVSDGQGGGIAVFNPVSISNSTISGNRSGDFGGGILVGDDEAVLTITNSTVADNRAAAEGGGIANPEGAVIANAITVVRNTAGAGGGFTYGIATPGFDIENSLVALNSATVAPDCFANPADPVDSGGHNLIGDDTDCPGFDATGDFVNSNPKLGQLKSNGGPTQTVALKKGSPAINSAGDSAPKKDQRGVKRGKKPDIGAYERVKKKKHHHHH